MDECRRRLRRKEDSDPWFAQVGHFIGFSYLPLNSWQVLCAPGTSSFLLSSVAFYTYCFLYSLKYAKRSRLAKGFTQLCALYFDVIVFSLKVILRATFKNLWKYIHMTIHWNRSQWYKVKGNCPLLPPISCSYFLDTHFLGIHDSSRKFVHIRTHLWVSSISKIYFLSPSVYWVWATKKLHRVRGGRYSSVLSQIWTHNLSPWLQLLPTSIHHKYASRAIFLKYCYPRVSARVYNVPCSLFLHFSA